MINNKGFVMIETIIVITILTIGLISLYASYSVILSKAVTKSNHDNVNYIYKTYYVAKHLEGTNQLNFTGNFKEFTTYNHELTNIMNTFKIEKIYLAKGNYTNIITQSNLLQLDGSTISYLKVMSDYVDSKINVIIKYKEYDSDPVLSKVNFASIAL